MPQSTKSPRCRRPETSSRCKAPAGTDVSALVAGMHAGALAATYDSPVVTDFWDPQDEPAEFEKMWTRTETGPVWVQ